MGTQFELISDDSLIESTYTDECSFCGRNDVPIFDVTGFKIEPGKYIFEDIPKEMADTEMDCACKDCLTNGRVKLFSEWEVESVLQEYCADPKRELMRLRATPSIPLFLQGYDWAVCCGELCEFKGVPSTYDESIEIPDHYQFWDKGPRDWKTFWSFEFTLEPESLDEISKFACKKCQKRWFIWQNT